MIQLRKLSVTLVRGHGRSTAAAASREFERLQAAVEELRKENADILASLSRPADFLAADRSRIGRTRDFERGVHGDRHGTLEGECWGC